MEGSNFHGYKRGAQKRSSFLMRIGNIQKRKSESSVAMPMVFSTQTFLSRSQDVREPWSGSCVHRTSLERVLNGSIRQSTH